MNIFLNKILPYAGMVIVMIVVGYFATQNHNNFEKTIVAQAQRQLLDTVRVESRLLNQRALNLTQEVEKLSKENVVREAFSDTYSKTTEERFLFLEDAYKNIRSLATSLRLLDARGVVIYKEPYKDDLGKDIVSTGHVQRELTDDHAPASWIINTTSGDPVLTFDQPVLKRGKFVGQLRAVIRLGTLRSLLSHYEGGNTYSFLLDQEGRLLSYPDENYLGKNVQILFQDNNLSMKESRFEEVMERVRAGEEGSGACRLLPLDNPHKAAEVIVAFSPVSFGDKTFSLITVIDYDSITGPVKKNARNNVIFAGVVVFVLFLSAFAFYLDQKRKNAELQRLYEDLEKNLEELRSTQSLLIQSAKMEVVGKLAAGVAHEVKNPLAVILLSAGYLKNHMPPQDGLVSGVLDDIKNSVNRADTIVKGLLDFSSSAELEKSAQNVHVYIKKSLLLVKSLLNERHIHVLEELGMDIPAVSLDGNKIEQVFVNLFMNAIQAMPSGGELRINTCRDGSDDAPQGVVVQIEDTGVGMPRDVVKDLFVPFVTTKRAVGGTGLGLSIVKNIMQMHGGKITLENKAEGPGVRATLWFKV
jgi:signal transduction histidine kinase